MGRRIQVRRAEGSGRGSGPEGGRGRMVPEERSAMTQRYSSSRWSGVVNHRVINREEALACDNPLLVPLE